MYFDFGQKTLKLVTEIAESPPWLQWYRGSARRTDRTVRADPAPQSDEVLIDGSQQAPRLRAGYIAGYGSLAWDDP